MRGKGFARFLDVLRPGITPAYAGKRYILNFTHDFTGDHPRVCGEKLQPHREHGGDEGSPPRMRGKEKE